MQHLVFGRWSVSVIHLWFNICLIHHSRYGDCRNYISKLVIGTNSDLSITWKWFSQSGVPALRNKVLLFLLIFRMYVWSSIIVCLKVFPVGSYDREMSLCKTMVNLSASSMILCVNNSIDWTFLMLLALYFFCTLIFLYSQKLYVIGSFFNVKKVKALKLYWIYIFWLEVISFQF